MEENRYNVFNQIHKGLRAMLFDTALNLQKSDLSGAAAAGAIEQLKETLTFFDEHAEHEDRYILPHIQKHNPQLIEELEKDHEIDHRLSHTLFQRVEEWKLADSDNMRGAIGQAISFAFSEFIAFNLYHMNKEENVLMYLLWAHYTDFEIRQMEEEIIHAIPPQTLMIESRWMMRAINDREVIAWLSGVKQGAPQEVFNAFFRMAQDELPANRLATVEAALTIE